MATEINVITAKSTKVIRNNNIFPVLGFAPLKLGLKISFNTSKPTKLSKLYTLLTLSLRFKICSYTDNLYFSANKIYQVSIV